MQSVPQLIPAGVEVTAPAPVPASATVSAYWLRVNVAVTLRAWFIGTEHAPLPEHAPAQLVNVEPVAALAVSTTVVPSVKVAVQFAPQLMPAGTEVTVPEPLPGRETASGQFLSVKVAVTEVVPTTVITQVPVPEHPPPLQPLKSELVEELAVSVTIEPEE